MKAHIFRDSELTAELWRRAWNEAEINLIEKLRAFLHNFLEERGKNFQRVVSWPLWATMEIDLTLWSSSYSIFKGGILSGPCMIWVALLRAEENTFMMFLRELFRVFSNDDDSMAIGQNDDSITRSRGPASLRNDFVIDSFVWPFYKHFVWFKLDYFDSYKIRFEGPSPVWHKDLVVRWRLKVYLICYVTCSIQ